MSLHFAIIRLVLEGEVMSEIEDQARRLESKLNKLTKEEREEAEAEIKSLLVRLALESFCQ